MRVPGRLARAALAVLALAVRPAFAAEPSGPAPSAGPVVLDVPFVPQSELLCGGAAVAMVLRYWGHRDVFAEDFAPLVERPLGGIRAERLVEALAARGFEAHVAAADGETLRHSVARGRPPIVLLEVAPGRRHYVVVVAWSGERVLFHDPADRPFRVASRSAIEKAWARTGHLALIVVPGPHAQVAKGLPGAEVLPDAADSGVAGTPTPETRGRGPEKDAGCAGLVRDGVALAGSGDLAGAELPLLAAIELCPGEALPRRELAGVRFRQERFPEAATLAAASVGRDPRDALAWRLLATSRYLAHDYAGALAAWNAVGEPEVDLVSVEGLDRTRPVVVTSRLGITPRTRLVPQTLRRSARRLAALPTLGMTRLRYEPVGGGRVHLTAAVVERPLLPGALPLAIQLATDAVAGRETRLGLASVGGEGGWLEAGARWWPNRPAGWLSFEAPGALRLPGVVRLEALYDDQRYATGAGATLAERRRRATLGTGDWLTAELHASGWLALERQRSAGTTALGSLALDRRLAADRVALLGSLTGGVPLEAATRFGRADARVVLRSSAATAPVVVHARAGLAAASGGAPLAYWPGAGTGTGRPLLLRAHPLLDGGIVAGEAFGRRLLDGGLELDAAVLRIGPVALHAATFVDAARTWQRPPGAAPGRWLADVGAGLRLHVPAVGVLRVDVATGAVGSAGTTLSAGWLPAWPR